MNAKHLTLALAVLSFHSFAKGENTLSIEPGLWSFENSMSGSVKMAGAPPMTLPSNVTKDTECIAPEDATFSPERLLREMREDGGTDCQYGDIDFSGRTMTTTIFCEAPDMKMDGTFKYEVAEDLRSGIGLAELNGSSEGMTFSSSFKMSGKWVKPCN